MSNEPMPVKGFPPNARTYFIAAVVALPEGVDPGQANASIINALLHVRSAVAFEAVSVYEDLHDLRVDVEEGTFPNGGGLTL